MKLWRKLSKKEPDGKRTGRQLCYQMRMMEQISKSQKRSYPLLDSLLTKAGVTYALTAKQQEALKNIIERENKEAVNETN